MGRKYDLFIGVLREGWVTAVLFSMVVNCRTFMGKLFSNLKKIHFSLKMKNISFTYHVAWWFFKFIFNHRLFPQREAFLKAQSEKRINKERCVTDAEVRVSEPQK